MTLDNITAVHRTRAALELDELQMWCSEPLEPKLDSIVLEDSRDCNTALLHVIVTLNPKWIPLDSWLTLQRQATSGGPLSSARCKVAIGVLGALKDMCQRYKVPPRQLYRTALDLTSAFLVHTETQDVLCLLPYVSMDRMYRSSNSPDDSARLRRACCGMVLRVLCDNAEESVLDVWWRTGSSERLPTDWLLSESLMLCKEGFLNTNAWSNINTGAYGFRDNTCVDSHITWLGNSPMPTPDLKRKLEEIGLKEPLRATVVEILQCRAAGVSPTALPKACEGLKNSLSVSATCVSMTDDMIMDQQGLRSKRTLSRTDKDEYDISYRDGLRIEMCDNITRDIAQNVLVEDEHHTLVQSSSFQEPPSYNEEFRTDLNLTANSHFSLPVIPEELYFLPSSTTQRTANDSFINPDTMYFNYECTDSADAVCSTEKLNSVLFELFKNRLPNEHENEQEKREHFMDMLATMVPSDQTEDFAADEQQRAIANDYDNGVVDAR